MEHLQCAKRQTYESEQECHDSSGGECGLLNMLVCVCRGVGGGSHMGGIEGAVGAYRTMHLLPHWQV